jgi:hypothetical protein
VIKRIVYAALIGFFGLFALVTLLMAARWHTAHRAPEQPIAFSHKIHANQLELECLYCHEYADKSASAGVPAVETCMDCHESVAVEKAEIQKLHKYWNDKQPIPWKRVHSIRIRDYVVFTHKRHVKAGIDCTECHGEVRMMDRVRRVRSLNMGWCVTCHRAKSASLDCLTCHK